MVRTLEKKRAQGRPGARCTRGLVCKYVRRNAHEHTGPAEAIRPSLRNTAYSVLSPATGLFCHRRQRILLPANLTPASGRQDHTASPSATSVVVQRACARLTPLRPPHPTPTSVTIMIRPSCGVGRCDSISDLG